MKNKTPTKIYTLPRTPIPRRTSKKEKKNERGPQRLETFFLHRRKIVEKTAKRRKGKERYRIKKDVIKKRGVKKRKRKTKNGRTSK